MGRERPAPPAGCDANREATAPLDFLVIEYLDGETLAARIARQPPSRSEALAIASQIAAPSIARMRTTSCTAISNRAT